MRESSRRGQLLVAVVLGFACGRPASDEPPPQPEQSQQPPQPDPVYEDPGFTLLGPPLAGGWRTRVDEPGQSFTDYQAAKPNLPTPERHTLVLQPIGPYPLEPILPDDLPSVRIEEHGFVTFVFSPSPDQLAAFLASFYGLPARVAPERPLASLGLQPTRTHNHHEQFDARALLSAVAPTLPDDAYSMTALIARDLVVDGRQEFAFGYGLHVDRLAVASFAQLDPQFAGGARTPEFQRRIRERSYKLLAHEVGHTLGFEHCEVHACVMNGVAHLDELDATPLRLCPECLRKLIWLVGVDPLRRYRELESHYQAQGLAADLAWVRARIERLTASD